MNRTAKLLSNIFNVGNSNGKETATMSETLARVVQHMPKGKTENKAQALADAEGQYIQRLI